MEGFSCAQFTFYNDFDSANLARVEFVPQNDTVIAKNACKEILDAEFNLWTKPDCSGTEFENGNRTWFYFGVKAPGPLMNVRFNLVDLNRQGKMYSQGMAPVYRVLPGKPKWDRILDKPVYNQDDDIFILTFKYRTPENLESITYFAFTYPFSYVELDKMLINIDLKYLNVKPLSEDDIYYTRETVCKSLEGRNIDLITITSYHGITPEREIKLKNLFMDNTPRPFKFTGKKVIFVSARVHPGETPSSFVFNGLLNLLLNRDDLSAQNLRRLYVFKMIPFLNPDGVARGHYRTDNRGVNLNRVYLNPSLTLHPSIYAARALIRYYHYGIEKEDNLPRCDNCKENMTNQTTTTTDECSSSLTEDDENATVTAHKDGISKKVSKITLEEGDVANNSTAPTKNPWCTSWHNFCRNCGARLTHSKSKEDVQFEKVIVGGGTGTASSGGGGGGHGDVNSNESGLFAYIDLHGHASKKGVFMYGNHFDEMERNVECMLLPKLMSINSHHFHFNSCNFTERNMYLRDKRDGMSRAGSGRVAVLSLTGIIKSYTLECNYNTGRIVNILPPTIKEPNGRVHSLPVPPKYTPQIFEEVGRSLGYSILDLTGNNPCSRLPNSEFHTLNGLRDWLSTMSSEFTGEKSHGPKTRNGRIKNTSGPHNVGCGGGGLRSQGKSSRAVKNRPVVPVSKTVLKKPKVSGRTIITSIPLDRKENLVSHQTAAGCSKSSIRLNKCFKAKVRKDLTLKTKNTAVDKATLLAAKTSKKTAAVVVPGAGTSSSRQKTTTKLMVDKDKDTNDSNLHLREICFIKNNEGKTVIAKYENAEFDDNLVVSWDTAASTKAQIYTHKSRVCSAPPYGPTSNKMSSSLIIEPSTSTTMNNSTSKQGAFRVHNFAKATSLSKTKLKKHSLRRLSSATDAIAVKADKKKKKIKVK